MTNEERLINCKQRILAIYPTSSILSGMDSAGNFVYRVTIPGVKIIESPNINALEVAVRNLELNR
jgi:hypothetical protein